MKRLLLAIVVFGVALPGLAATIRVPNDFPTIQAAVDAAAGGDRVKVFPGAGTGPNGEYEENVVIDTAAVILHCVGTVVDVSTTTTTRGGVDFSAGITVTADDVEVRSCTVQFAQDCTAPQCPNNDDDGDGIDVDAHRFTAFQVTVIGNQGAGVVVDGHFARLESSTGQGSAKNFFVRGNDGVLSDLSAHAGDVGIEVEGDRNAIGSCRAEGVGSGFHVDGSDNVVSDNDAESIRNRAYRIIGDGNTVDNNTAQNSFEGFNVQSGTGVTLTRNTSSRNSTQAYDLVSLVGATVADNLADGNATGGFVCSSCDSTVFLRNVARDNGREGFRIGSPTACLFDGNHSIDNHGDGFNFSSCVGGVTLTGNFATRNGEDGIDVDCDAVAGIVVTDNTVNENLGTGIENDAQSTDVTENRLHGNRTDIAGAGDAATGSVGLFFGNVFTTGGPAVVTPGTGFQDP